MVIGINVLSILHCSGLGDFSPQKARRDDIVAVCNSLFSLTSETDLQSCTVSHHDVPGTQERMDDANAPGP